MKPLDLSLYLVLDPDLCGGHNGMLDTARLAARHGVSVVQLRAPGWKKRQWLQTASALKALLDHEGVPLIINDHVDIALAVDAAGVHLARPICLLKPRAVCSGRARSSGCPPPTWHIWAAHH